MKSIIIGAFSLIISIAGYILQSKHLLIAAIIVAAAGLLGSIISLGNDKKRKILIYVGISDAIFAIAISIFFWIKMPGSSPEEVEKMFDGKFDEPKIEAPAMEDLEKEAEKALKQQ